MLRRIAKEKKQTYLKHKNIQQLYFINPDNTEFHVTASDASEQIIELYENKLTKQVNKGIKVKRKTACLELI